MTVHRKFNYKSLEELKEDISNQGLYIPVCDRVDSLTKPVTIGGFTTPNSLLIHPMEGCDGTEGGAPGELTYRRYNRFARGGAGLLWFEACAVACEGRANPHQLFINENNVDNFRDMLSKAKNAATQEFGAAFRPVCILQLTHSGRYSKPKPLIPTPDPYLGESQGLAHDYPLLTDDYLERLEGYYEKAACLAEQAGFDGVDIKACHGYLMAELFSAYTREGKYGGDFQGRTRLFLNVIDRVKRAVGRNFIITTRMNVFDGQPYPYGWGVERDDYKKPDMSEPLRLINMLSDRGIPLVNITMGNPYYTPHINRPYDRGLYTPPEHPLKGIERMIQLAGTVQKQVPGIVVAGSGYTWLRQYGGHVGAGVQKKGMARLIGFGRQAFAYPDFAKDLLNKGQMDKGKVCISCSMCTVIMRDGGRTGCVVRDAKVYGPILKEGRRGKIPLEPRPPVAEHV